MAPKTKPPAKKAVVQGPMKIEALTRCEVTVPLIGITPLIVHRQGAKAAEQMFIKQRGGKKPKTNKNPVANAIDCCYLRSLDDALEAYNVAGDVVEDYGEELQELLPVWLRFKKKKNKGYGFPATGFLQAAIRAGKLRGLVMTDLRTSMTVPEMMVTIDPIDGDAQVHFAWVRVQQSADLRFRPIFHKWRTEVTFTYLDGVVAPQTICALLNDAGWSVGVGEWRPEKKGPYGRFQVDLDREVKIKKLR